MDGYVKSHKDLIVWQKSMIFVEDIYRVTKLFPKEEMYTLTSQMRRSAISIPSNIAEGRRRGTRKDYARFVQIAYGSGAELETQVEIAYRLGYLDGDTDQVLTNQLTQIMKMLNSMQSKLKMF